MTGLVLILINIVGIWVGCGALARGFTMAHFQTRYAPIADETYNKDLWLARFAFLAGPFALLALAVCSRDARFGNHFASGWRWK